MRIENRLKRLKPAIKGPSHYFQMLAERDLTRNILAEFESDEISSTSPGLPSDAAASAALKQVAKEFEPKPEAALPIAPASKPSSRGRKRRDAQLKTPTPAPK